MKTKITILVLFITFWLNRGIYSQNSFSDNFSGTLSAWTDMYGGDWSIQNNELHGFYSLSSGSIYDSQADLILKDQYQLSGNWKASIDFIRVVDDEFPQYISAIGNFSLWQDNNNKISIQLGGGDNDWGGIQDSIQVYVQEWDGTWASASVYKFKHTWNPDNWHTASIEKRGNVYSIFIDEANIGHYVDNFLNGSGKIGLHNYGTKRYDNFNLEPISCELQFEDNFSGTLSAWTDMYGGDWSIQNNELHGFYSLSSGSIYDSQADLILKDQYQLSGNWKASIDFIRVVDDEFPQYISAIGNFSLWQDNNNKISIQLGGGDNDWGGIQDSIQVYVQEWDGTWASASVYKFKHTWNPDNWHTASIEKRGNVYSIFIDDAGIGYFKDEFLNGSGKIGLHTYGTKRYDNFKLENCSNLNTGIENNSYITNNENFCIYPNPVSGSVVFAEIDNKISSQNSFLSIYNAYGSSIDEIQIRSNGIIPINIELYSSGIYFLIYQSESYKISKKLIVK